MNNKGSAGNFAVGLLVGAAIGAAAALLYAPNSGKDTREMLKEKAEELKETAEEVRERAEELREKAAGVVARAKEKVIEMRHQGEKPAEVAG